MRHKLLLGSLSTFLLLLFSNASVWGDVIQPVASGHMIAPQPSPLLAAGTPIGFGDTVSGNISSSGQQDTYTFNGTSGDRILVRMTKTSGGLYPNINVYHPNGDPLCQQGGQPTAEVSCTLTNSGTHAILVGDLFGTGTGDYNLYLGCLSAHCGAPVGGIAEAPASYATGDRALSAPGGVAGLLGGVLLLLIGGGWFARRRYAVRRR